MSNENSIIDHDLTYYEPEVEFDISLKKIILQRSRREFAVRVFLSRGLYLTEVSTNKLDWTLLATFTEENSAVQYCEEIYRTSLTSIEFDVKV